MSGSTGFPIPVRPENGMGAEGGKRRRSRRESLHAQRVGIFRILYRMEFYPPECLKEQEELFLTFAGTYLDEEEQPAPEEYVFDGEELQPGGFNADGQAFAPEDAEHMLRKVEAVISHIPELDERIDSVSRNWRTARMGRVELAILRLALYEILYDDEVPAGVAINEAVELTKEFGDDQSPGFVNAVLGRFA